MGNTIVQAMNPENPIMWGSTSLTATFYTFCTHFVSHCTINLKWQLCSFFGLQHQFSTPVTLTQRNNRNEEQTKNKNRTKTKQETRQAHKHKSIHPLFWYEHVTNNDTERHVTGPDELRRPSCPSNWLTAPVCIGRGEGGRGCSEWHTIAFYMKSTYIQPFGDMVYTCFHYIKTWFFWYILATKKYDILIFQLVGYAVHIAMSQFHIFELWWVAMTLISTSSYDTAPRYVMTHE